jgi:HSP20 family protein
MAMERWRQRGGSSREQGRSLPATRDFEGLIDRFFGDWPWAGGIGQLRGSAPALDMMDRKDEVLVRADLPGLEQKDLDVAVENNMLTIRGERKGEEEASESDYYCCERWSGSFVRTLSLPPNVDASKIRATFKNGVLEVHLPKTKEAMGRKIEIQAA